MPPAARAGSQATTSQAESLLLLQLTALGVPAPVQQFRFHPPRRWAIDLAYPAIKLAIECEGGVWSAGRHVRPSGFIGDLAKYNQLALDGWRLLRVTPQMVESGEAAAVVLAALGQREEATR